MPNYIIPEEGKIEYIIGIDFGHGETSAAICKVDSDKVPIDIDMTGTGVKAIPSAIYIEERDGVQDIYIGDDAVIKYGNGGDGAFHAYFKHSYETYDESIDSSISIMKLFMREVYKAICHNRSAELMDGDKIKSNHVVFIACPSKSQQWSEQSMQNYVRIALEAGLPIAGANIGEDFKISGIVRESRAAYIRTLQQDEASRKATKGILVIDYGSSTIDITYYKKGEKPVDKGYQAGASTVEEIVREYLKEYHVELGEDQNPEAMNIIEQRYPYKYTKFLFDIRESKEIYYKKFNSANSLEVKCRFKPQLQTKGIDVLIPRSILNELLHDYEKDVRDCFVDFKDNVIKNSPVTLLVLTGGASTMNFVRSTASSVFGDDVIVLLPNDSSLTVSNGIATAGRADVKMFQLIQNICNNDSIMKPSLYSKMKSSMVKEIASKVINVLSTEYYTFKEGNYPYSYSDKSCTIKLLESNVKNDIDRINYRDTLNSAYASVLTDHINSSVLPQLRKYTQEHFPTFELEQIRSFSAPSGLSLKITSSQLSTLDSIVKQSVDSIEEGFFEFVGKTLLNIVGVTAATIGYGAAQAEIAIIRGVQAVFGVDKKNRVSYLDSNDYDSLVSDLTISYRDNETNLEYEKRSKVYQEFQNRESGYEEQIKSSIENSFPLRINDIEIPGQRLIRDYLFGEFNHIQSLIK